MAAPYQEEEVEWATAAGAGLRPARGEWAAITVGADKLRFGGLPDPPDSKVWHCWEPLPDEQHHSLREALEQLARARPEGQAVHARRVYHNLLDPNLSLQCVRPSREHVQHKQLTFGKIADRRSR